MDRVGTIALGKSAVWRMALLGLVVLLFAGCSLHATRSKADSYSHFMQQAKASLAAGNQEDAKKYYGQAANADPTKGAPWYQMAKIEFGQQDYGLSIVNAHEAIRRDPGNTKAQSILTVSGLRVAVQALGNLHDETDPDGPAHKEAMQLASKMRHVLGQQVLVPPATKAEKRSHASRHRVRRRHVSHKTVAPKPKPKPAKTYSNPFGALPGGG